MSNMIPLSVGLSTVEVGSIVSSVQLQDSRSNGDLIHIFSHSEIWASTRPFSTLSPRDDAALVYVWFYLQNVLPPKTAGQRGTRPHRNAAHSPSWDMSALTLQSPGARNVHLKPGCAVLERNYSSLIVNWWLRWLRLVRKFSLIH